MISTNVPNGTQGEYFLEDIIDQCLVGRYGPEEDISETSLRLDNGVGGCLPPGRGMFRLMLREGSEATCHIDVLLHIGEAVNDGIKGVDPWPDGGVRTGLAHPNLGRVLPGGTTRPNNARPQSAHTTIGPGIDPLDAIIDRFPNVEENYFRQ